jgi:hypothetical protein
MEAGWKKPYWIAMASPALAQLFEGMLWQGHITASGSFPLTNMDQHSGAVDIGYLQRSPFTDTQTTGVNGA